MIQDNELTMPAARVGPFVADRDWWCGVFAVIDSADAAAFAAYLTDDAHFRFGNAPAVIGRDAIRAAVAGFCQAIASSKHRLLDVWNGVGTAVCEGEVTYGRHDGTFLTAPFVNVFTLRFDKIASYRIYIDNSALFAAAG